MAEGLTEVGEAIENLGQEIQLVQVVNGKLIAVGVLFGLAVGGAVGYFVTKKRIKDQYDEVLLNEIAKARKYYEAKKASLEAMKQYKQPLSEVMEDLGYKNRPYTEAEQKAIDEANEKFREDDAHDEQEPEPNNPADIRASRADPGFPLSDFRDHWDYADEVKKRAVNPYAAYIIHADEHGDKDYTQDSYTYYARDNVLTDAKDEVIENVNAVVGIENLQKFGHGSQNPNLLLIRNDRLSLDIDITRLDMAYSENSPGLQHSENRERIMRRGRRFDDDEK